MCSQREMNLSHIIKWKPAVPSRKDEIMKRLSIIVVLLVGCIVSIAFAGQNISGIWVAMEDNPEVSNLQVIYSQIGTKVNAVAYFEYKGVPCVWHGNGTVSGNKAKYSVNYSKHYPGWNGADGKHVMTISTDGKTMTGNWYNQNGDSGRMTYSKKK